MQPHLWQLLVVTLAGWVNRFQQDAIEYLKEENRVLREHVGGRRLLFTDEQPASSCSEGEGVEQG